MTRPAMILLGMSCGFVVPAAALGQWSNAQLLNDPSEAGVDVKTVKIAASKNGGFHAAYSNKNNGWQRYRRYANGSLGPAKTVFTGMNFNNYITEALNGDVHLVFENWAVPGQDGPEVGWTRSTDGGNTFSAVVNISATGGCSKHPHIAPFGTGSSAEVVMSYYRASYSGDCNKSLYFNRFNGSGWTGDSNIGSKSLSEYDCFGMAWSPLNGSIYRSFDPDQNSMRMRQYTGSWGAEIPVLTGMWPVRQHMAINNAGQVMLLWDSDSKIWSILYTPGSGFGPLVELGPGGYSGSCNVCAIPGTNKFYMVLGKDQNRVVGRRWINGVWLAEEPISNGLALDFTVFPDVTADSTGALYCAWEYWGSKKPQQYFSTKTSPQVVISPTSFSRSIFVGQNLPNDSFIVTNGGTGTINYTMTDTADWLTTSTSGGSATFTQDNSVAIQYAVSQLHRGTYNANITIAAPGAFASPATIPVTVQVNSVKPDSDGDGDVDQEDFGRFQACYSGSSVPQTNPECANFRLDADEDVDLNDFGIFQGCMSGPNRLATPGCAG